MGIGRISWWGTSFIAGQVDLQTPFGNSLCLLTVFQRSALAVIQFRD